MLRVMRENAGSWLIKIILGLIIVVFVLWGVGSFRDQGGGRVATVDGESITFDEYRKTYDRMLEQVRTRFGAALDDKTLKMLNLKQQAINQLIDQKIILGAAREMKLVVSEQELVDSIKHIDAFQSAGTFDRRRYQGVLGQLRMTPEEFEAYQQETLLVEKLRRLIVGSVKVSEQEAWEWYTWSNASVDLDYLFMDPAEFQNVSADEKEIQTYFEANKQRYFTEPKVRARYVRFPIDDYAGQVEITESDVENYYEAHREDYRVDKQVEARHILFKLAPDAAAETVAAVRRTAAEIAERAAAGEDFSELARQYSEGPSAANGGYLGTFAKDEMVAPFSEVAFAMQPGEISDPVRTQFGWHVIRVENVLDASEKSLSEASLEIRRVLTNEAAAALAYDDATALLDNAFADQDLISAADAAGFQVRETGWFTPEGPAEIVSNPSALAEAAFNLEPGDISELIDLGSGYAVLQVQEKQDSKAPALEAVKDRVRSDVLDQKRRDAAKTAANRLSDAIQGGKKLEDIARETGKALKQTGFFKRGEPIPEIGYEREIIDAAFLLSSQRLYPEKPLEGENGFFLVRFRERRDPSRTAFEKERNEIILNLVNQKRLQLFDQWLSNRKDQSEIKIKEEILG